MAITAGLLAWLCEPFFRRMKGVTIFAFVLGLGSSICVASLVKASEPTMLEDLIQEALANNSDIVSQQERVAALELEAPYSGSFQDPVLGVGLLNLPVDSFEFDQEPMTQKQLFVSQKFPWFGTLGLRQQTAELRALEARSRLQGKRLELRTQVSSLCYDTMTLYRSIALVHSQQDIVSSSLRIAESRYTTGKGLQQDILEGHVQLTELIRENVVLKSKVKLNLAQLAQLLNRKETVLESEFVHLFTIDEQPILPPIPVLVSQAYGHSPVLQEKRLLVDRSKVELQLAKAAYYPNFDLRLSYGQREDDPTTGNERADFVSATLAMTVPLYQANRQDAKLAAAEKRLKANLTSLEGFRRTLPHDVSRIVSEIEGLQESYQLLNDALSVQTLNLADASLAAYSVGKVEFRAMLGARISLLRLDLRGVVHTYQILKKIAELEQLLGVPLPLKREKNETNNTIFIHSLSVVDIGNFRDR